MRIALVPCTSRKRTFPSMAENMYTTHQFQLNKLFGLICCERWYIISAKYGLVHPKTIISPYNLSLKELQPVKLSEWSLRLRTALEKIISSHDEVFLLCTGIYLKISVSHLREIRCKIITPYDSKKFLPCGTRQLIIKKMIKEYINV